MEQLGNRVSNDPIALILETVDLDQSGLNALHALELSDRRRQLLDCCDKNLALLDRRAGNALDPVEVEQIGRVLDHVDNVVDRGGKPKDVLAVKRGYVLGIEEMKEIAGQPVADVLDLLDLVVADRRAWEATEPGLRLASCLQRVRASPSEEVVELGRSSCKTQPRCS